jgi:ISXO2-like transposase domain/Transposase zinc-ribbon domain
MSSHQIQFQTGMSIREFLSHFGTEAQCAEAIKRARWPNGFRCPRCAGEQHYVVGHGARKLFQCGACRHQTSLTAGTLMEHTKLPLTTWFMAIHLISQAKTGLSALALKRDLGVSYPTAWLLHHKINNAMAAQEAVHRLDGVVQLDDAYLGGERAGGKPGRGSENKVPFVAAVSINGAGQPVHLKLDLLSGFTSDAIAKWAKVSLMPTAIVTSDGLGCFAAVTEAGCVHMPKVVGALKPRDLPEFKWVNTVLGNLKTTLAGAFKALKYRKYAQTYLAAFAYRFNRRFDLRGLLAHLIVDVTRSRQVPEKVVRSGHAETRF